MFCGDLIHLVRAPEGVGAELLLRCLLHCMLEVAKDKHRQLCTILLALDLLRIMEEAISYFYTVIQDSATAEQTSDLYGSTGVYRTAIEHLWWNVSQDIHTGAARAYLIAACAQNAFRDISITNEEMGSLKGWLEEAIDGSYLRDSVFGAGLRHQICPKKGKTAYLITLLSTGFFQGLEQILYVLRDGIQNGSAIVRSRSWKGSLGIFNNNTRIRGQTRGVVASCLSDPSARVREAALVSLREDNAWMASLVENGRIGAVDLSPAIRKQFLRIFEKSYLAHGQSAPVAACYMLRGVSDDNASVAAAAQETLRRLWLPSERNGVFEERLEQTLDIMTFVVQQYPGLESSLCQFIALNRKSTDFTKCKMLVAAALRKVKTTIDAGTDTCQMLHILAVFAQANRSLFTPPPYPLFLLYLSKSSMEARNTSFRHVASVFVQVIRCEPDFDAEMLVQLKDTLLQLLKVCKGDERMDIVTICLWKACDRLKSYPGLFKLIASLTQQISEFDPKDLNVPGQIAALAKAKRLIKLIGFIGKNFFDNGYGAPGELRFYHWYPKSIINSLLELFKKRSSSISHLALQSVCRFCYSWPDYVIDDEMSTVFHEILTGENESLQITVTEALLECLLSRERDTTRDDNTESLNGAKYSLRDQVALLSTEQHLPSILLLAMQGHCRRTFMITRYIATVSRQGLTGPSKVYGILVALGTSQDTETAQIANREHRRIHCLKQSAVETSYVEAVRQSFIFQQEITRTPSGAIKPDLHAKLIHMFQAINSSQKLLRKSFLSQICSELMVTIQDAQNAMYVRYIVENLALYPFERPEDLEQSICHLQRVIKVQRPEIVQGTHEIFEHCPASMSSEDQSLALLRTTTRNVAILIVEEGYSFLQKEMTFSKQGKDFKGTILKYHRDQGSLLLESIEKRFQCLIDDRTTIAHCQNLTFRDPLFR
jgi:hypothetical protein